MMGRSREPGLSDVLFDSEEADFHRFATEVDDLYVIPAGASVPNPAEMLGSRRMSDLLGRLRETFDVVVIDTPPVLAVTDAMLVSPQCDAVVLVSTADETTWQMLERADETLRDVGTSITGVVLNRYTPKAADASYGYGYYEYYGSDVQQKQEA
jgi:capsular exopolysaccharide synthesis family protein